MDLLQEIEADDPRKDAAGTGATLARVHPGFRRRRLKAAAAEQEQIRGLASWRRSSFIGEAAFALLYQAQYGQGNSIGSRQTVIAENTDGKPSKNSWREAIEDFEGKAPCR